MAITTLCQEFIVCICISRKVVWFTQTYAVMNSVICATNIHRAVKKGQTLCCGRNVTRFLPSWNFIWLSERNIKLWINSPSSTWLSERNIKPWMTLHPLQGKVQTPHYKTWWNKYVWNITLCKDIYEKPLPGSLPWCFSSKMQLWFWGGICEIPSGLRGVTDSPTSRSFQGEHWVLELGKDSGKEDA